jgi:glycosyltransferase involved in cell wall biosynthesis
MRRLHFVYADDPNTERVDGSVAITKNLYNALIKHYQVIYHRWDACHDIDLQPDDIFLGHPNYPPETVTQRVFAQNKPCRAKCLIHPLHTRRVQDNFPFDGMARAADLIFSICGPYWYDTLPQTPFAHWQPKIIRLDMAVNSDIFPRIKTSFNQKRKLVYIGSATEHKNLEYLAEIMKAMPDVQLSWYGGFLEHPLARLKNVRTVGWQMLVGEAAKEICDNHDIFVNVSVSDANPTTLLEASAWGLIAGCTPQSGYYQDSKFFELKLDDVKFCTNMIRYIMQMSEAELLNWANRNREEVVNKYNWKVFTDKVIEGLKRFD